MSWKGAILKNFPMKSLANPPASVEDNIHEIVPGLFLAGYREASDDQLLTKKGITNLVTVTESPIKLHPNRDSFLVPCRDIMSQSIIDFVPSINDYIHQCRLNRGRVLVHCMCGVSRGPTTVIAYLMSTANLNCQDAYNAVIATRTYINPNPGFRKQLQDFEMSGFLDKERMRIKSKFPTAATVLRNDEIICRERILSAIKNPSSQFYTKFPTFFSYGSATYKPTQPVLSPAPNINVPNGPQSNQLQPIMPSNIYPNINVNNNNVPNAFTQISPSNINPLTPMLQTYQGLNTNSNFYNKPYPPTETVPINPTSTNNISNAITTDSYANAVSLQMGKDEKCTKLNNTAPLGNMQQNIGKGNQITKNEAITQGK